MRAGGRRERERGREGKGCWKGKKQDSSENCHVFFFVILLSFFVLRPAFVLLLVPASAFSFTHDKPIPSLASPAQTHRLCLLQPEGT